MQNWQHFFLTMLCGGLWAVAIKEPQPWQVWPLLCAYTLLCLWMPALDRSAERLGDRLGLWMHYKNRDKGDE